MHFLSNTVEFLRDIAACFVSSSLNGGLISEFVFTMDALSHPQNVLSNL